MTKSAIRNPQSPIAVAALFLSLAALPSALWAQTAPARSGPLEVVQSGPPIRKSLTLMTTQPARIEPLEQAPIYSKLAAYVAEVLVDYGDAVKQGQPLVRLAAPELDADLAQRQALVEQAQAEVAQAEAGAAAAKAAVLTARSQAAQAEAATARVQADIDRWRSELARIEQLAASGSINRQLVDETQQKFRAAEASFKETVAAIDAAQANVGQAGSLAAKSAADVDAARARVKVAQANLAQVDALRSYLTLSAPLDGVVTLRRVDPGHFVQPAASAAPLLVVARTSRVRAHVAVPEIEAGYVNVGDPVALDIPALRATPLACQVTRTSFAVDPATRSLETIVDLDNRDGRIRPGVFALARITLQEQKDALTLPSAAVVRQGYDAFCYRLIGGKAVRTPIAVGLKVGDDFEIVRGLTPTDAVILNKAASLQDGQPVEARAPEAKK